MASGSSSLSSAAAATMTSLAAASASTTTANATATATATASVTAINTTNSTVAPVTATIQTSSAKSQYIPQQRPNLPPSQAPTMSSSVRPQIPSLLPLRYPLASSGRGFINSSSAQRPPVQTIAGSNPNPNHVPYSVQHRSTMGYPPPPRSSGFSPSPPPPLVKGFPVSANPHLFKVGTSVCSLPDCVGGHKVSSDGAREDVCVVVRDRKVRISNGASIYALCRSWLRNGHPEEIQPQYADVVRSLPKPAPASLLDKCSPKRKKLDQEEENDIDVKAAENLSSEELLQLHIKRAKKVREGLREERLQRIARYKSRLALLLPPPEPCRNDPSDVG